MKNNEYFKTFFFDNADYERSCTSKNKYDSEWQAKFAADEQMKRCNVKLSWYKCKYCNGWHLTSR